MFKRFITPKLVDCVFVGCCVLMTLTCGRVKPADPPSIVLITIDTLRADHLSTYGYFRQTSPNLDNLAGESALFENTVTTMATTLPAHASLMTSTLTTTHGLKGNFGHLGGVLDEETGLRTMAEMLSDLGYETAAFVSATPLRDHTGMQRGFVFHDQPSKKEQPANTTTDKALAWLEAGPARPFFLWIHYFDPHRPRRPPSPYDRAFEADSSLIGFLEALGVAKARDRFVVGENNAYDGEILFTDSQIGRIFETLKSSGEWQDMAVVVTSDHGEGLGQHNWMDHGRIYNEQLFVPLIIKFPRGKGPQGVRIQKTASLIDVLPTLVATLDLPISEADREQFEGTDLLGEDDSRPGVFSEQSHRDRIKESGLRFSLTNQDWKYFYRTAGEDELYDMITDSIETRNVIDRHPEVAARMQDRILEILAQTRGERRRQPELDQKVVDQLHALGYLGGEADENTSEWQGMAVWGHEVREFRPCGSERILWLIDEDGSFGRQYQNRLDSQKPYQPVYVEIEAREEPAPLQGFGAEYTAALRLERVLTIGFEETGCPDS